MEDHRIRELERRVEELEEVIEGLRGAMKPYVENTSWTRPLPELILHNMGKVVMSFQPPVSK